VEDAAMAGFKVMALSASVKTVCLIVALSAWCGGMWINVRAARRAHAAGYRFGASIQKPGSQRGEEKTFRFS